MALDVWPFEHRQGRVRAVVVGAANVAGRAQSGEIVSARTDGGGFWRVEVDYSITTDDQRRAWGGLIAGLDGVAGKLIVPVSQRVWRPEGQFTAVSVGAAPVRSTQMSVSVTEGISLLPGHHFTLVHNTYGPRLYAIVSAEDQGGGVWALKTRPPLREAIGPGLALEFDATRLVARLGNAEDAVLAEDGATTIHPGRVEWVEAVEPI